MKLVWQCLAVGTAGCLGAIARMLIGMACAPLSRHFPTGTFLINLSGSFLLGWLAGFGATRAAFSETARMAIAVGFLGAYTTFSTFMLESDLLIRNDRWDRAVLYVIGSLLLGLLAVRFGAYVGAR